MPHRYAASLSLVLLVSGNAAPAAASEGKPPATVGQCAFTRVTRVEQRLEDGATHRQIANSGSAVMLANGVYGVSYDEIAAVNRSLPGDRAMTCLARLPTHCPPGDGRGRWYVTVDLRTDEAWMLPDSEHMCGGA